MLKNEMTELLKIKYPIIQAPMAGGITTSELVAAVSNNGGLGMIGAGYMTPAQIREHVREVRKLTQNHFGVNLLVPSEFTSSEDEIVLANIKLDSIRNQLNVHTNNIEVPNSKSLYKTFMEQLSVVVEEKVPVCSFTFGIPSPEVIDQLKHQKIILIGTATTVLEAIELEKAGMDMIVAQGSEAGGHRGNFISDLEESLVGLMSLIPQVVDHVTIPVIAAGGIMDGRGLMASLCLGAKGVQMGSAFLTCKESGAPTLYKEAILNVNEEETVLTRAFSGKWARGIKNKFISEMQEYEQSFPEFPIQNTLTQDIRKASMNQNNKEYMSLWSGQSPRLAKNESVESLIHRIMSKAIEINEKK